VDPDKVTQPTCDGVSRLLHFFHPRNAVNVTNVAKRSAELSNARAIRIFINSEFRGHLAAAIPAPAGAVAQGPQHRRERQVRRAVVAKRPAAEAARPAAEAARPAAEAGRDHPPGASAGTCDE
jgi:hypothetical protein